MKYVILALGIVLSGCQHPKPKIMPEGVNTAIVGSNIKASKEIAEEIEKRADFILLNWDNAK